MLSRLAETARSVRLVRTRIHNRNWWRRSAFIASPIGMRPHTWQHNGFSSEFTHRTHAPLKLNAHGMMEQKNDLFITLLKWFFLLRWLQCEAQNAWNVQWLRPKTHKWTHAHKQTPEIRRCVMRIIYPNTNHIFGVAYFRWNGSESYPNIRLCLFDCGLQIISNWNYLQYFMLT